MSVIMRTEFKLGLTASQRLVAVLLDVPVLRGIEKKTAELEPQLLAAIARLPQANREVIERRYGYVDGAWTALDKIGTERGNVTKERIRQVEASGIRQLCKALAIKIPPRFESKPDTKTIRRQQARAARWTRPAGVRVDS